VSQNYEYFGKYILLEKLATGGMAEVWLARAPGAGGIGRFVAIKKILPQYSDNPEFIQMFKDEATIAMNLSHSNIVSIYEFGQEKNQLFLVMDYVEGRNLRQILNKMKQTQHKFSSDQIIYAIKEVAAGLDHAHRSLNSATGKPLNITHRDISPQNVMVTFEGEVKIVDFGIAKAESQMENTRTGTLKGKFGYMSPEQADGQTTDLRTDVFSLGIVLWELFANDRLFIANNEINTLRKIRECNVPSLTKLNPNTHPELERITMKALTRDRNLRYQTAAAMHRDLNRFLNRHYPDFTPHDFSVFIKTLYTDEILDLRKRLIEYAKIPFRPVSVRNDDNDRTLVTSFPQASEAKTRSTAERKTEGAQKNEATLTATETFSESGADQNPDQVNTSSGEVSLSPSQPLNTSVLDNKFLQQSLKQQLTVNPKMPQALSLDEDGALQHSGPHPQIVVEHAEPVAYQQSRLNRPGTQKKSRRKNSSSSSLSLLVVAALAILTYVVATIYMPNEITQLELAVKKIFFTGHGIKVQPAPAPDPNFQLPEIVTQPTEETTKIDQAIKIAPVLSDFKTTVPLVVNSIPSGAEIYINGLNTGKTTPSRVEVPADSNFAVALKLERYLDYSKTNLTTEITGRSFTATMQKAMVAYVNIDVRPSRNVRVFVNGQQLRDENLPINRYAVPAGTPVRIRAENPFTGESSEEVVTLKEDQRYNILLKLGSDRKPSNRR